MAFVRGHKDRPQQENIHAVNDHYHYKKPPNRMVACQHHHLQFCSAPCSALSGLSAWSLLCADEPWAPTFSSNHLAQDATISEPQASFQGELLQTTPQTEKFLSAQRPLPHNLPWSHHSQDSGHCYSSTQQLDTEVCLHDKHWAGSWGYSLPGATSSPFLRSADTLVGRGDNKQTTKELYHMSGTDGCCGVEWGGLLFYAGQQARLLWENGHLIDIGSEQANHLEATGKSVLGRRERKCKTHLPPRPFPQTSQNHAWNILGRARSLGWLQQSREGEVQEPWSQRALRATVRTPAFPRDGTDSL